MKKSHPDPTPMMNGDLVDVLDRCGWRRGVYLRRAGALHRVLVLDVERAILFTLGRVRPAQHCVTVETVLKSGRHKDLPRSRWSCSCGAGKRVLSAPRRARAAAIAHFRLEMARPEMDR